MGSDLNVCANIVRVILIIINILFVILGIVLIGIGSWLVSQDSSFSFITNSSVISGAVLLIIAGIVTVIICAAAIFGAIFKLRPVLVVYAIVLFIIVVLEIVGGILGFVFSDNVVGGLEEGSLRAIRLYSVNPEGISPDERDATTAVDAVQNTLNCCGYTNFTDWINENPVAISESNNRPPGEGCAACTVGTNENCVSYTGSITIPDQSGGNGTITVSVTFDITDVGCINRLENSLVLIGSVGGGLGVVFGILEITGIIFSLALCCCITSARKQEVV